MRFTFSIFLAVCAMPALAFPVEDDWMTASRGAAAVADAVGDPRPDLFGDPDSPGLYWYADGATLSFRVRVSGIYDPTAHVLAILVSTDEDATTLELAVAADGPADEVAVYTADGLPGLTPNWTRSSGQGPLASASVVTGGLVDFEVPRAALEAVGWTPSMGARVWVVSGSSYGVWTDVHGCTDLTCDSADVLTSGVFIDRDLDGLTDPIERVLGLPWADADADDDGVLDGDERLDDGGDADELRDVEDCDSDGDGLTDGLESGITEPHPDTNVDARCFVPDSDPSTTTDVREVDSDAGGLFDAVEDVNRDGVLGPWETDPNDGADDVDTDGDGIADVLEALGADGSIDDVDSDGDGVSDAAEWLWDDDEDGIPAFQDDDSDGDGFSDVEEGQVDTDEDGRVDAVDADSDGDGRPDVEEGRSDLDCDGIENRLDSDDFDGFCDSAEVIDAFVDEVIERPPGDLGRCQHGSSGFWLWLVLPLVIRRRR